MRTILTLALIALPALALFGGQHNRIDFDNDDDQVTDETAAIEMVGASSEWFTYDDHESWGDLELVESPPGSGIYTAYQHWIEDDVVHERHWRLKLFVDEEQPEEDETLGSYVLDSWETVGGEPSTTPPYAEVGRYKAGTDN